MTITLSAENYVYDGTEKKPAVTVKDGQKTLTEGTDYTVSYVNHTAAGTAIVTVTGKGNYTGTVTRNFEIVLGKANLTATVLNYNSVQLTWDKMVGVDGYVVYRATGADNGYKTLKTVAGGDNVSCISTSLATGTTYYYKVRAYVETNGVKVFGAYSEPKNVRPKLETPQNVQVKKNTYNTLKISWNAVDGASYYQVYRSDAVNGKYALLGTYDENRTSMTSKSLKMGVTYYYKVRGYRWVNGERVFSPFSTIVSAKPILSAPKGVKAVGVTSSTVKVSWDKTEGVTYYQVYRATSKTGKYSLLGVYDKDRTSMTSKSLKKGTTYYYKVRGYRWVNGERVFSPFSIVTSATTK